MKLKIFDKKALQQWLDTGYNYIKLTNADNIGLTKENDSFTLVEPYIGNGKAPEFDSVVPIASKTVEQIIKEKSGKYYK